MIAFDSARRFAWLRLWRSENVGPRTFDMLLRKFGSAEAALDALPDLVARTSPGRAIRIARPAEIEKEFATAERMGARFICRDELGFPALLREIVDAPAVIAVRGRPEILDRPAVAIIGSRNASAAGLAFAERLARGLAQAGYVVVSGFARGIDSRAHRASLATGTIAVLAGGHDRLYPADQAPFMDKLLEDGAAVSEMPFGWEARGRDFPRRNRIVSGMALGVVVVEAARRSGSLITARFAADQGREVFAVPGSPLDPRAEGTNDLLRDGATFCADVEDVIRALADQGVNRRDLFSDAGQPQAERFWDELEVDDRDTGDRETSHRDTGASASAADAYPFAKGSVGRFAEEARDQHTRVVDGLGPAPISVDELARSVDLPVRDVRTVLLELELAGRIERHGGGLVSLLMA